MNIGYVMCKNQLSLRVLSKNLLWSDSLNIFIYIYIYIYIDMWFDL